MTPDWMDPESMGPEQIPPEGITPEMIESLMRDLNRLDDEVLLGIQNAERPEDVEMLRSLRAELRPAIDDFPRMIADALQGQKDDDARAAKEAEDESRREEERRAERAKREAEANAPISPPDGLSIEPAALPALVVADLGLAISTTPPEATPADKPAPAAAGAPDFGTLDMPIPTVSPVRTAPSPAVKPATPPARDVPPTPAAKPKPKPKRSPEPPGNDPPRFDTMF